MAVMRAATASGGSNVVVVLVAVLAVVETEVLVVSEVVEVEGPIGLDVVEAEYGEYRLYHLLDHLRRRFHRGLLPWRSASKSPCSSPCATSTVRQLCSAARAIVLVPQKQKIRAMALNPTILDLGST